MTELIRTDKEIDEQLDLANEGINNGSKFHGMSYEEGVKNAIEWMRGDVNEKPMDD